MADGSGAIDLGALPKEDQEAVERMAEQHPGEQEGKAPRKVLTAFLVLVGVDGNPEVVSFDDDGLSLLSPPTSDLVYGAVQTIAKDIAGMEYAQASAQATLQAQIAQARAIHEQQQAQQIAHNLGNIRG